MKFFHPPHLYCVTALPSKTNTAANIGVVFLFHWLNLSFYCIKMMCGLTAHTTAISSSRRVCCLTSEQYVVITGGHCSRMERQRTPPGSRWTIWKKSTSTSLNLACGLQIALILIPWITLVGILFSNESTARTWLEQPHITVFKYYREKFSQYRY